MVVSRFVCIQWHVFAEVMDLQLETLAKPCDTQAADPVASASLAWRCTHVYFRDYWILVLWILRVLKFDFQDLLLRKTICFKLTV